MKIIKVNVYLSIGYANANKEDTLEIELEEGMTEKEEDKEISEQVQMWAENYIDMGWSRQ